MRTPMRILTGMLALLVMGATTAAADVGGSLDASGKGVVTDSVAANAGGSASASASASTDLPPAPDVDAVKAELEGQAAEAQELAAEAATQASTPMTTSVESAPMSANGAAEAAANLPAEGAQGGATASAATDLEGAASSSAAEADTGFLDWLRGRIAALVTSVHARISTALADEPELPEVDANVGAAAGGALSVEGVDVAGGVEGALDGGVSGLPETPALPEVPDAPAIPGVPDLPL